MELKHEVVAAVLAAAVLGWVVARRGSAEPRKKVYEVVRWAGKSKDVLRCTEVVVFSDGHVVDVAVDSARCEGGSLW